MIQLILAVRVVNRGYFYNRMYLDFNELWSYDIGKYWAAIRLKNGNFYGQCVPVTLVGEALERTAIIMEALGR